MYVYSSKKITMVNVLSLFYLKKKLEQENKKIKLSWVFVFVYFFVGEIKSSVSGFYDAFLWFLVHKSLLHTYKAGMRWNKAMK